MSTTIDHDEVTATCQRVSRFKRLRMALRRRVGRALRNRRMLTILERVQLLVSCVRYTRRFNAETLRLYIQLRCYYTSTAAPDVKGF